MHVLLKCLVERLRISHDEERSMLATEVQQNEKFKATCDSHLSSATVPPLPPLVSPNVRSHAPSSPPAVWIYLYGTSSVCY